MITTCKVGIYLDDSLIANTSYHFRDEYNDPRLRKSVPLTLRAGKKYKLRVDAGESYGDARVQLVWATPSAGKAADLRAEALAVAGKADAVVMCMGISSRLEGEEMDVNIDGFKGGDRTSLDLPKNQEDLIRAIQALGKPVVLVMVNGERLVRELGSTTYTGYRGSLVPRASRRDRHCRRAVWGLRSGWPSAGDFLSFRE